MAAPTGIKTRFCIISDTHTCTPNPPQQTSNAYRHPLPRADILIHAGDLTKVGYLVEHETTVAMLKEADSELKLVIAGNHDISLDEDYFTSFGYLRHGRPERLGGESILLESSGGGTRDAIRMPLEARKTYVHHAKELYTNDAARAAGIRYLDEGLHTFTLSSGARITVYASPYQPEFCRWAFGYPRSQDRFNTPPFQSPNANLPQNTVPDYPSIDLLLTHGPPAGILDAVVPDGRHVGCTHLLRAAERARPRMHAFGHIHEGYGAVRGTWDTFSENGVKLENVPWDQEDMLENRGAFYDVSALSSDRPLRFGDETLFVNASVVTVGYEPRNAPWVVDLDLPFAGE